MPKYTQSEPSPVYFVEPGKYNVEIVNAVEKSSSKGNEMIKLICQVILQDGTKGPQVHEHLTFVNVDACRRRIDSARQACGYAIVPGEEKDVKAEDFIGKTARVILGEEEGTDNGHRFNKIERWMLPTESAPKPKTSPAEADEIPF
jgi:hypothetical protein